jgi:hypothetical protein
VSTTTKTSRAITARDGIRNYPDVPIGNVWSLTTLLKTYPKELAYGAGSVSMKETARIAHEVAQDYAKAAEAMRYNDDPAAITSMFEDFEISVLHEIGKQFASNKDGSPKPPHAFLWAEKGQVGEAVHAGVEYHYGGMLGKVLPSMEETDHYRTLRPVAQARAQISLTMFHAWAAEHEVIPIAVEEVLWLDVNEFGNRNKFACRIDLACILDGEATILDVKSGGLNGKKPYREQMVQTEMQRRAAEARDIMPPAMLQEYGPFGRAGILHIPAEGGRPAVYLNDEEPMALLASFDACASLFIDLNGEPK